MLSLFKLPSFLPSVTNQLEHIFVCGFGVFEITFLQVKTYLKAYLNWLKHLQLQLIQSVADP